MSFIKWFVTYGCKLGMRIAYRIDDSQLKNVPYDGPLIVYGNHTGTVEVPILFSHLAPRPKVTGLAKFEIFGQFFIGWVFKLWNIIPVKRGEPDVKALRACIDRLKNGYIIGLAPEGTRNRTGELRRAQSGITVLALHGNSPLQPVAHWGTENLLANWLKLRRPHVNISVGQRFVLDDHGKKITKEIRQEMADEIMYQLAKLLPEKYRGEYSDLSKATENWIRFLPEKDEP